MDFPCHGKYSAPVDVQWFVDLNVGRIIPATMVELICQAINARHLVSFYYAGDNVPGQRIVEPHMVAYNRRNNLALSAWFLGGASESGTIGWKEYLFDSISNVAILPQQFAGPRPGYNPTGGKVFHNVQCAL